MDRRQQKTRNAIFFAFEKLLTRKNYNKITVQEIIDEANVGRTTFYAHFETKDELLEEMCTTLFDHVFADYPGLKEHRTFVSTPEQAFSIITHMLYHLRDNGTYIRRLITGESSEIFLRYFSQYINEPVTNCLLSGKDPDHLPVPVAFLRNHISGSFVNMVQWWMATGMTLSPDEMAVYFLKVIEPVFYEKK